ncbi:MAG: NUDIX domain-containing protein [Clostridia bacterium]|nr:NUDIX domain-containing protein [Clostridia bacterium]
MEGNDIRLMIGNIKFSARAVAVIKKNDKILFQKRKNDQNWALPGGAIGTMETGAEVVLRELAEETGETEAIVKRPLWFAEYFFTFNEKTQHQYILGYLVDIPDDSKLIHNSEFDGIEEGKNIIYKWIDIKNIKKSPIKPEFVKDKLLSIKKEYEFITENEIGY